jgi:hypothetical protein
LGYSSNKKGYKCYDPKSKRLYISRDVTFVENEPYYKNKIEIHSVSEQNQVKKMIPPQPIGGNYSNENEDIGEVSENLEHQDAQDNQGHEIEEEIQEPINLRRSSRQSQPSTRLRDYVTYEVRYPIQNFISYKHVSNEHKAFISSIQKEVEPIFYYEAIKNENWCKAMEEELGALEKNKTWDIVSLPKK